MATSACHIISIWNATSFLTSLSIAPSPLKTDTNTCINICVFTSIYSQSAGNSCRRVVGQVKVGALSIALRTGNAIAAFVARKTESRATALRRPRNRIVNGVAIAARTADHTAGQIITFAGRKGESELQIEPIECIRMATSACYFRGKIRLLFRFIKITHNIPRS